MSYHGLSGLGLDLQLDASSFRLPTQQATADWRTAVKSSASIGANAITALPAQELASARKAAWNALRTRFVETALITARPNTETDPARRRIVDELARAAARTKLGAGVPADAPTARSQVQWARDAAPAVDAVRAAYALTLAALQPPTAAQQPFINVQLGPQPSKVVAYVPLTAPYVKTGPTPAEQEAERKRLADAAAQAAAQRQAAAEQAAAADLAARDRAIAEEQQKRQTTTQEPEKERYAPQGPATVDLLDAFGPPPGAAVETPATATPVTSTQTARPGLLGVPWLWWGIGGAVVVVGGGYAAYRNQHVTPNRRRRVSRNAKMKAWTVKLHGREIDIVHYTADMTAAEVKRSLVGHDGYDPSITVHAKRKWGTGS